MPLLTRELIAQLQQAQPPALLEAVACPEWGEDVTTYVRMMTSAEAEVYERRMYTINRTILDALEVLAPTGAPQDSMPAFERHEAEAMLEATPSIRIALVRQTACDPAGTLLFTPDDDAWLGVQPAPLIKRLFDAAWRLNRLGADAVEESKKNSAVTTNNDSGTSLRSNGVAQILTT